MKERLQSDLREAMKSRDTIRLMTIRGVLAEVTRVEKDTRHAATESEIIAVLKRERAHREEALGFARQGKRQDLVDQYEAEARVLDAYIPAAAGAEEIKAAIAEALAGGATQIGPVMKALRERFGARLDNKLASDLVREALASRT